MTHKRAEHEIAPNLRAALKLGVSMALVAFLANVAYLVAQTLQVAGAVGHPSDEILIYGSSLIIATPFLIAMLALHYLTPEDRKLWSHAGVVFSIIYAVCVTLNYVVQLGTVIPASLHGQLGQIEVLNQTPHSLFWDFDGLGYIFLGLATLFASRVFAKHGIQNWARIFFLANALVTPAIVIVYFYPVFSTTLLLLGGIPWIITSAGSMLLLGLYFWKSSLSYRKERT